MKKQHLAALATAVGVVLAWAGTGAAQAPPTPDQMVAALKQNLAESQKRLRQYRVGRNDQHQPEGRREVPQAAACVLRR